MLEDSPKHFQNFLVSMVGQIPLILAETRAQQWDIERSINKIQCKYIATNYKYSLMKNYTIIQCNLSS